MSRGWAARVYLHNVIESDREALGWLRRGNPRGFDAIYARYRDRIYAFLFRLTGRRDAADDLFQETFLALASKGPALWPDSNLGSWLFTVARHAFLDAERRRRPGATAELGGGDGRLVEGSSASLPSAVTLSEIERGLLALSSDDRQLLLLVGVEGMGQDEVARVLEIEPGTLRQRVVRARARLAGVLDHGRTSERTPERNRMHRS
jgi:RNA polymerase sigma-70 factor (ECF subfamily)